jgi:hypothetical protein
MTEFAPPSNIAIERWMASAVVVVTDGTVNGTASSAFVVVVTIAASSVVAFGVM